MNADKLKEVLSQHKKWLDTNGKEGCQANLRYANLRYANLENANLENANLRYANLENANLENANLRYANLGYAYLGGANLASANLENAYLVNANLRYANLENANLENANLRYANLGGANLENAYLRNAYLENANLRNANLGGANLSHFQIVPREGAFIAYKKVCSAIVKLEIPEDANRTSSLAGRKCRASKVKVLGIVEGDDSNLTSPTHPFRLTYTIGTVVEADSFDPDIRVECTNGIHFYMTVEEAREH